LIMADIASELANKCGISVDSVQKGLGAVLGLLKSKLPADSFARVSAAIPGADNMMSSLADTGEQASGGVLGAVKGAVGKLFGGGTDSLLAKIGQLGIAPDKLPAFMSGIVEHLKGKVPENVLSQVSDVLPAPQEATH
jgi:hypothetical protein